MKPTLRVFVVCSDQALSDCIRETLRNKGHQASAASGTAASSAADLAGHEAVIQVCSTQAEAEEEQRAAFWIEAAQRSGLDRFLVFTCATSAGGAARATSDCLTPIETRLAEAPLTRTVIHAGALTDEPPRGTISASARLEMAGPVSRRDAAEALVEALLLEITHGKRFAIGPGDDPIPNALVSLRAD